MTQRSLSEQEAYELNGAIEPISAVPEEFEFVQDIPPNTTKRDRKTGWLTPAILGMGLGVMVAMVGMHLLSSSSTEKAPAKEAAPVAAAAPATMTVTIASPETTSIDRTLEATGTVAAYNLLPVLPQANGLQIKEVPVEEGQSVKFGQILAILDNSILLNQLSAAQAQLEASKAAVQQKQAALGQAQSDLARAQAALAQAEADRVSAQANEADARSRQADANRTRQRYEYLAKQGAISTQDLDTRVTTATSAGETVRSAKAGISRAEANITSAKANISSAQASIESAKANLLSAQADVRNNEAKVQQIQTQLRQTQVLAPASGIVVAPSASGQCDGNATAGTTAASQSIAPSIARVGDTSGNKALFCIIRNGYLELQVKVSETELDQIDPGATVKITGNGDSKIDLEGKVRSINPVIDPQTRQATIKVDLPANSALKPGMFLKAAITTTTAQTLTVPATAVQRQSDGKPMVYLLDANDIAHIDPVDVGTTIGGEKGELAAAKTEIKSGVKPGDRVVVAGAGYLKDGDKVKVVDAAGEQGSKGAVESN